MNISSTMRRTTPARMPQTQGGGESGEQPPADEVSFSSGLAQGGRFTSEIAGPLAGLRWGFKAGMELSIALGQYEVGPASLVGAAAGGVAGYFIGRRGPEMAGKAGAFLSQSVGVSAELGSAIGTAALGSALGGGVLGVYGAGIGATIAVGTGVVQHFKG